jgi:hypothetical protein
MASPGGLVSGLVALDLNPSSRTLRQFGFVASPLLALSSVLTFQGIVAPGLGPARVPCAGILALLALSSALFSLLAPRGNRPLYVSLSLATFPLGLVLSHVFLAALFFGVLTPLALAMRLVRRDALSRRLYAADSYWAKARRRPRRQDYFRQY